MSGARVRIAPRHRWLAWACGRALTLAIALAGTPSAANAAAINVTAGAPDVIANDGVSCSLREAIINANNDDQSGSTDCAAGASDDVINLPAGTYTLAIGGTAEDLSATGDLDVRANLTISGAGAATTILDGGGLDNVVDNVLSAVTLEVSDVTIRNANGSGVRNNGGGTIGIRDAIVENNTSPSLGGGIFNNAAGTVNVTDVVVRANTIMGFLGGAIGNNSGGTVRVMNSVVTGNTIATQGSAIYNNSSGLLEVTDTTVSANMFTDTLGAGGIANNSIGTTNVTRSTISGNMATMAGTSASNSAGGINNNSSGLFNISNSTISGNSTASTAITSGGGIYNNSSGLITIENSTIFDNAGGQANSVRLNSSGDVSLKNTIIATNAAGANCSSNGPSGVFISLGNNIAGDASCGLTAGGDQPDTDPMLEALEDNGGPTSTHEPLAGSPAIDMGSGDCPPPATDQRGQMRPVDGAGDSTPTCDVGAVEVAPGSTTTTLTTTTTLRTTTTLTTTTTTSSVTTASTSSTTTTSTSITTTTTGGFSPEVCGNCLDDDGDGLTDFEDPGCCTATNGLTLRRASLQAAKKGNRLELETHLTGGGLETIDPTKQDLHVQIRAQSGELLCARIPATAFKKKRMLWQFVDRKLRTAGTKGIDGSVIRLLKGQRLQLRVQGKKNVELLAPVPGAGAMTVTAAFRDAVSHRCASAREPFRVVGRKSTLRFP